VTQEKTVVVRESELISQAVARVSPSIVRLYTGVSEDASFIGLGLVVDVSGVIAADSWAVGEGGSAAIGLADGSRVRAFVTSRDKDAGVSYLQATTTKDVEKPSWTSATLSSAQPVLGQTVFMLSGKTVARIGDGIIEALMQDEEPAASPSSLVIDTNISEDAITAGSPLVNTDGHVVGISTYVSRATAPGGFLSAGALMKKEAAKADNKSTL
jgi:S1-C subfamily serine protease